MIKHYPNIVSKVTATISGKGLMPSNLVEDIQKICNEYTDMTGRYCTFTVLPATQILSDEIPSSMIHNSIIMISTPDPEKCVTKRDNERYVSDCKSILIEVAKQYGQASITMDVESVLSEKYILE